MVNSKLKFYIAILIFAFCIFNLMGCATYKFHHGKAPYNKGYVVSRDDYTIVEYTIGKDNTVPNLKLAKERFKIRRDIVEDYYKRMGYIENHFKMVFWGPVSMITKVAGGVFRLPFIAISDYRAAHNPQYKERLRKIEDKKDAREEARVNKLKDKLNAYIQKDLARREPAFASEAAQEPPKAVAVAPIEQPPQERQVVPLSSQAESITSVKGEEPKPIEKKEEAAESKPAVAASAVPGPTAVIIAKPNKGFSPLKVHFYGSKSYAPKGRIVVYSWDFGDQDTSTRVNPTNTYYSGSFQPQYFKVTLTVQDDKGNTAKASATIEVLNK